MADRSMARGLVIPGSSTGGAPADASYVVIGSNATLTAERTLTGTANQITITDNGANSTVVLSTPQNIHTGASPTFVGLTLTGLTAGSIPFVGASDELAEDNGGLFYNNASNFLGVGVGAASASRVIHASVEATGQGTCLDTYVSSSGGSGYLGRKARGTFAAPRRAQTDDVISGIGCVAAQAADDVTDATWPSTLVGQFRFFAAENQTTTAHGGYFTLQLTPIGSTTLTNVMRISPAGNLLIGTGTTPLSKLHIDGQTGWIIQDEQDTDPTTTELDSLDSVAIYNKSNKFVIAYNNGGTITYISIPLDGSTTTWTHSTTAP